MDPVREQRARWARLAALGQRVGYLALGVATAVFVAGFAIGFTDAVRRTVATALGLATATLAPAIVVGYAVKAAEREDRERGL